MCSTSATPACPQIRKPYVTALCNRRVTRVCSALASWRDWPHSPHIPVYQTYAGRFFGMEYSGAGDELRLGNGLSGAFLWNWINYSGICHPKRDNANLLSKPVDLPLHLQHLVDYIAGNLDGLHQSQLSAVPQLYTNLFPLPGSKLTDHTDAVQHEIDTVCASSNGDDQCGGGVEICVSEMLAVDKSNWVTVLGPPQWTNDWYSESPGSLKLQLDSHDLY